jgi:uncharacterized membrane protein
MNDWNAWLARWADAGLVDADTADRIRAYEQAHAGTTRLRWPILIALAFGALMLGGGVLLFVAAHWDTLSPDQRFGIVLLLVAGFHVGGALVADRFPGMATTLHALGTVALGGGISLAGQIFNLDEHWPSGILLWAIGAGAAWWVLRQIPQLALLAVLAPAWLVSEWTVAIGARFEPAATRVAACGVFLCALAYVTSVRGARSDDSRRALQWIGGLALLPASTALAFAASRGWWHNDAAPPFLSGLYLTGWTIAIGVPMGVAVLLRREEAWLNGVAAIWAIALVIMAPQVSSIVLYPWWALGAVGLVAWGIRDGRSERVNLGAALFAATVLTFYFSQVMDKLGRSASLIGLGLLFLAGGWALERTRRRLVVQAREAS